MALADIIKKSPVIDTPRATDLAEKPHEWDERFRHHVSTHVVLADMTGKWDAILKNLLQRRSATGLIHADTGYGKTSTAAALWQYAENRDVVTVPPFAWHSIADMLIATHGWICFRLNARSPDLIPDLELHYRMLIESSDAERARRISQDQDIPLDHAKRVVQSLKAQGELADAISANRLIDYLRKATSTLLEAGYKGLLILPDEFELFANTNPDIAKNFSELKNFIFPIFQEENLPIGCVVLTYRRTFSEIQSREPYVFARFNKPEGSLIDLEQAYGKENKKSFAHDLWEKLSVQCNLSYEEQRAIDPDVLISLGQFLGHQRTTQLISGPRSVVATFRRAALHYTQKQHPYSIFDFCEDYVSQGLICFNNQETDTVKAHASIMSQPIIGGDRAKQRVVKLLCVYPDGVPEDLFCRQGISYEDRLAVVEGLLGSHVITKVIGPTLNHYKDDLQAADALVEILKVLRNQYNSASAETHRAAVRSFANFIVPKIFSHSVGASPTGWSGLRKMEGDIEPMFQAALSGSSLRYYPSRTLTVHVGTENFQEISGAYRESQMFTSFVLYTQSENAQNTCDIHANKLCFHLNISRAIDNREIPKDIGKLGDLFLPEAVTPSLLLSMLDFFQKESTIDKIKQLKQEAQVQLLQSRILDQLISFFFSSEIKESVVSQRADFADVPAGKDLVERALGVLIQEKFKSYRAIAISLQWQRNLGSYIQALQNAESLGVRRGEEPVRVTGGEVPRIFNVGHHTTFSNTFYPHGIFRDLLLVNELDANGNITAEGVEVKNNQGAVAVYFKLHHLEDRVLNTIEKSGEEIIVDGKPTKAIKYHELFQQETQFGYLDDEIEFLVRVLKARGLVDQTPMQGIDYLFCVETEINFAELQSKFQQLEALEELAGSRGFTLTEEMEKDNSLSSARDDLQTVGIETDEVHKDSLRQKLIAIEDAFKTQCARCLNTEMKRTDRKRYEFEPLRLDIPRVLDETTGHPLTEFSTILFQDIRLEVKKAYTAITDRVSALQDSIQDTIHEKIQSYREDQRSETAINVAAQLRDIGDSIDKQIEQLGVDREQTQQLNSFFEKWRMLAKQVESDRLTMADAPKVDVIKNLSDRLCGEQQRIKKHLADRTKTVKQVLENHEYFSNQIKVIKAEFNQISEFRKDDFIRFQASIQDQLHRIISKPDIGEMYNPSDEEGSYRRVREKAIGKIRDLAIEPAIQGIKKRKSELMKPIEIFTVSDRIKKKAIDLNEEVNALENKIIEVNTSLISEDVDAQLPAWIESLNSILKSGTEVFKRWEGIQDHLRCDKGELSSKAQALLDLIELNADKDLTELIINLKQSGTEMFGSTLEIIESLEELYKHNWLNIKVSRTTT